MRKRFTDPLFQANIRKYRIDGLSIKAIAKKLKASEWTVFRAMQDMGMSGSRASQKPKKVLPIKCECCGEDFYRSIKNGNGTYCTDCLEFDRKAAKEMQEMNKKHKHTCKCGKKYETLHDAFGKPVYRSCDQCRAARAYVADMSYTVGS